MRQTSVERLFEFHRERLKLVWIAGARNASIGCDDTFQVPGDLAGYLNIIHPERLHVLGIEEIDWASRQPEAKLRRMVSDLISARPPCIIVADGCEVPEVILEACLQANVPLMSSPAPSPTVIELLRSYLARELANTVSIHGVFMDVLGMGVLITGESGIGKSELALELISRGHGLVADDIVEVARVSPTSLEGRCPEMLKDFLEVRGLGVLNIRTVFGEAACRRKMKVNLVFHLLRPMRPGDEGVRLPIGAQTEEILEVPVRKVVVAVAAGRNLAVLLEAAVRSTILMFRGIDTTAEFVERQRRALEGG